MKNMAVTVIDRLFLVVYGSAGPTDEEWVDYLALFEHHGVERIVQLIWTEGGEPTSAQRDKLGRVLARRPVPVAVVTGNARVRMTVTVLSWFNRRIRVFRPSDLRDAIAYLGAPQRTVAVAERALGIAGMAVAAKHSHERLARASRALGYLELFISDKRTTDEEIGDAIEIIERLVKEQRPAWQVWLKVATTVLWVLLHAYRAHGRAADRPINKKS